MTPRRRGGSAARRGARLAAGAAAALATLAGIGWLSQAPYAHERAAGGELRLAWRARSARIAACRERTAEELARLPEHMRVAQVCERRVAPYRLEVRVNDSTLVGRLIEATGARADHPLYVFEEVALAPGTYALHVAFLRQNGTAADSVPDPRVAPTVLTLDTTVAITPGRAVLVTYDEGVRRLRVRDGH